MSTGEKVTVGRYRKKPVEVEAVDVLGKFAERLKVVLLHDQTLVDAVERRTRRGHDAPPVGRAELAQESRLLQETFFPCIDECLDEFEATYEPVDQDGGEAPEPIQRIAAVIKAARRHEAEVGPSCEEGLPNAIARAQGESQASAYLRELLEQELPPEFQPQHGVEGEEQVRAGEGHRVEIEFEGDVTCAHLVHPESGCSHSIDPDTGEEITDDPCWITDWIEEHGIDLLHGKVTLAVTEEWDGDCALLRVNDRQFASTQQAVPSTPGSDLERITERLEAFSKDRDWGRFHTPRNFAMSIAIEVGELLEHFQWKDDDELREHLASDQAAFIEDELADVLIYTLNLALVLGVDPAKAINDKISRNELRFPAPTSESKGASK